MREGGGIFRFESEISHPPELELVIEKFDFGFEVLNSFPPELDLVMENLVTGVIQFKVLTTLPITSS